MLQLFSARATMEFWIKVSQSSNINVEIYSGVQGQNYYVYSTGNNVFDEWTKIVVNLDGYSSVQGSPSLQNASKLNFIVAGVPLGETATFWIKDIKFSGQEYVVGHVAA
jgi:hypothetical protein